MFLECIRIANFKSLKDIEVRPSGLTALVGPNNAGKTNFALAMKFLSEVHQYGLEKAVVRAGGIENIAFRRVRRSRSPIAFDVQACWSSPSVGSRVSESLEVLGPLAQAVARLGFRHRFACEARGGAGLPAGFQVPQETFEVDVAFRQDRTIKGLPDRLAYVVRRDSDGRTTASINGGRSGRPKLPMGLALRLAPTRASLGAKAPDIEKERLFLSHPLVQDAFMRVLVDLLAGIRVFRFSSGSARRPGAPTPNPVLGEESNSLPSVIDWLRRKDRKQWQKVLNAMRDIVPGLEDIIIEVLPSKTLGLFFAEKGFGRPWRADEVSDGTMHALSILVAAADPRVSALLIEEPENSLHPWILEQLIKTLRQLAEKKTVILTTQSPVVVDLLHPSETWIVSRRKGATRIRQLTRIDPRIEGEWREGVATLSEYLGSGLIPDAVPGTGQQ